MGLVLPATLCSGMRCVPYNKTSQSTHVYTRRSERMKTDNEVMNTAFESIFSTLGMVDAERFIMLLKRDKFDYTEWQKILWQDETVESLSEKA